MSRPTALFYHCMVSPLSIPIVAEQMKGLADYGLGAAAQHFVIGLNSSPKSSAPVAKLLPKSAKQVFHGEQSRSENLTIVELEKWLPDHPGWNVLYFHTKGATHRPGSVTYEINKHWRRCMMRNLVLEWRKCIADLEAGFESVGCHWYRGIDKTQNFWAGTFFWATSDFLMTLPSIMKRPAVIKHGIASIQSRYEAEVWIGNGPRLPKRRDYHPNWHFNCKS